MSNSLDPDQNRNSVCKGYQQTTKVSESKERAKTNISTKSIIINRCAHFREHSSNVNVIWFITHELWSWGHSMY